MFPWVNQQQKAWSGPTLRPTEAKPYFFDFPFFFPFFFFLEPFSLAGLESFKAARAAASRAIGTLNGEQLT
jgi:hypothetical protein